MSKESTIAGNTPLDNQIVKLMNVTGQMNIFAAIDYIKCLQDLLRFDSCPELLIQYPYTFIKKPSEESMQWAKGVIARYENSKIEQPIVVRMSEDEYKKYDEWINTNKPQTNG